MCTGRSTGEDKGQSSKFKGYNLSYFISEWSCAQTFSRVERGPGVLSDFSCHMGLGHSLVWGLPIRMHNAIDPAPCDKKCHSKTLLLLEGSGTRLVSEAITIFFAVSAATSTGQDAERCCWMLHCGCIFQLTHTGHVLNVCGLHQSSYEQGFWWANWCELSSSA